MMVPAPVNLLHGWDTNTSYIFSAHAAVYAWVSLCKSLPATRKSESQTEEDEETEEWSAYLKDYDEMHKQSLRSRNQLDLLKSSEDIEPCDPACASPLMALAVGAVGNDQAEIIYNNMMEFARYRGSLCSQ